jgi:hypothetical protein
MQLKINHTLGSESCVYSWYSGPHGSEQGGAELIENRTSVSAHNCILLVLQRYFMYLQSLELKQCSAILSQKGPGEKNIYHHCKFGHFPYAFQLVPA